MLFPTIDFFIFFGIVFAVCWWLNEHNREKKLFLTAASYFFYSCWNWHYVFLLLCSALGNFFAARWLEEQKSERTRQWILIAAVAANLLLLGYFKYYDFVVAQIENMLSMFGVDLDIGASGLPLPVAISFLTFHGISYVVDVRQRKVHASRSLVDVMLYLAFFPHLVAGPIVRAADFMPQLARRSDPDRIDLADSLMRILGGLFKKVIIASYISTLFVDPVFTDPAEFGRVDLVLAAYAYAIVIFCDFSAYTDIATGVAALLGYTFPPNFDQPYRATSLQDFWRRWHITLSFWLRDYVYISALGGSHKGRLLTYRNVLVTMLLGGLWHGAGWQFLIWGGLHGLALVAERIARDFFGFELAGGGPWRRTLGWLTTFNFVCVAWIFFRVSDFSGAMDYFHAMIVDNGRQSTLTPVVAMLMAAGFAIQFVPASWVRAWRVHFQAATLPLKIAVPVFTVWSIAVAAPAGVAPFIYFQF